MSDLDTALSQAMWFRATNLSALIEFLRIPSISTLKENAPDVARAAEVVVARLKEIGMDKVESMPGNPGEHPLITAEWMKAPGKPVVLLYAHYDVQPVDPLDQWTTPPFEPTQRDGL